MTPTITPFFVVDRPISLEIIKGLRVPKDKSIGLMAHANTTSQFRKAFKAYSKAQTIKMCDSAIFDANRRGYKELFERYQEMGANYGVMIDVISDTRGTLLSAEKALAAYNSKLHGFRLVGVAQGRSADEYIECYRGLRNLGLNHIAVGGLLQRRTRTARYMNVGDEELMRNVLRRIKNEFDPTWLFALGCLHPSRLPLFKELNVWGDYKGWIFEYEKKDETLAETVSLLKNNHLQHAAPRFRSSQTGIALTDVLIRRGKKLSERRRAHNDLLNAKRTLRDFTAQALNIVAENNPDDGHLLRPLRARALLGCAEQNLIVRCLARSGVSTKRASVIYNLAKNTRDKKDRLIKLDNALSSCNRELLEVLQRTIACRLIDSNLRDIAGSASGILSVTEQAHRIGQVRLYIESKILRQL
jgi:hypothetical protein